MDKKRKKADMTTTPRAVHDTSLREENTGKKRVDANSMLRMEHLQKLATWASVEAGIPSLGALFGHRLAASAEAEGVPLDPSTFVCHRCESILQPGFNCTVRIEKNAKKAKHRKKTHIPSQNNVVYKCHFCSHRNILRGTQRGYVKGLLPSRPRPDMNSDVQCSSSEVTSNPEKGLKDNEILDQKCPALDTVDREVSLEKSPLTPLDRLTNLAKKRKKKKNGSAPNNTSSSGNSSVTLNSVEATAGAGSSKRKRKGWSSLKEIAERNEARKSQSIGNFAIPFSLQTSK